MVKLPVSKRLSQLRKALMYDSMVDLMLSRLKSLFFKYSPRLIRTMFTPDQLKLRDYTLIIDRSASMSTEDQQGGKSRWAVIQEATLGLARACEKIDPDGITVYVFAGRFTRYDEVNTNKVEQIFKEKFPAGGTNLGAVLSDALNNYFQRKESGNAKPNGEIFLVVTDGAPDDKLPVIEVIVEATRRIEQNSELGISFIQIGSDPEARRFLKELDDDLKKNGAKYNICDTITFDDLEDIPPHDVFFRTITD